MSLTLEQFKKEALAFWRQKQTQALKEGCLNPQIKLWGAKESIDISPPAEVLNAVESPLDLLPPILRKLGVQGFVMVCETWMVQGRKDEDPGDTNFTKDLAKARRLNYHPQRIEALCAMIGHCDYSAMRFKPMIRTGSSESDKLVGLGTEEVSEGGQGMEGRFEICRRMLVRE